MAGTVNIGQVFFLYFRFPAIITYTYPSYFSFIYQLPKLHSYPLPETLSKTLSLSLSLSLCVYPIRV